MASNLLAPMVYFVGAEDWDRRLFDELILLPEGTTYNSYLIKGKDKTALLDTVDPTKESVLLQNLKDLKVDRIDYVIVHHAEQDHSGSLLKILELFPSAKVITNQKCKEFLVELLLIPEEKFIIIRDRETLSLGDKTLEFIFAPWVHWPETMFSYLREDKILFTCDFLGSHYSSSNLFVTDQSKITESAKRYFAEVMMPFRTSIKTNLEKIKGLEIEIIAASHGPIYNKPEFILRAYAEWISDESKNEVIIPYVSMHGSTAVMVEHLVKRLSEKGLSVKPFNLTKSDLGELAMALVDASSVIIASPTVLAGAHPVILNAVYLVNALRPKLKYAAIIGSYGWGGKMAEQITAGLSNLKVELLSPVIVKGFPKKLDLEALDRLADEIVAKHQSNVSIKK